MMGNRGRAVFENWKHILEIDLEVDDEHTKPRKQTIIPNYKPYEWKVFVLPKIERVTAPKRPTTSFQFNTPTPEPFGICSQPREPRGLVPCVFWPHELEPGYNVPIEYLHFDEDEAEDVASNEDTPYPPSKAERTQPPKIEKLPPTKPP